MLEPRQLISQLSHLESGLEDFSFEELNLSQATKIKSSFSHFKSHLEELIFDTKSDIKSYEPQTDNEVKSLLGGVAHEIGNPLNGLIGFLDILKETKLTEEQFKLIRGIDVAASQIQNQITGLKELCRLQSGQRSFKKEPLNIRSFVEDIELMSSVLLETSKVRFDVLVDEEVSQSYKGDTGKLTQIMLNLVGNAVKFVEKGSIILQVSKISQNVGHDILEFMIADTGIGIADEEIERIFDVYYQSDKSNESKASGLGLGLSITKELVTLMGGCISVSSTLGVGTTFKVTLPMELDRSSVSSSAMEPTYQQGILNGKKILVVEDNSLNLRLLEHLLHSWHCDATLVSNGRAGLLELEKQVFDAVLLDLRLPKMSGTRIVEYIRSRKEHADIPVIGLSADIIKGGIEEMRKLGFSDFIWKPYNPQNLYKTIAKNLDENFQISFQSEPNSPRKENSQTLFDLDQLKADCGGNQDLINELLSLFQQNVLEFIGRMKVHLQANNWKDIAFAAHKIKSSLTLLDASSLNDIANEIFELGNQGGPQEKIQRKMNEFIELYALAEIKIKETQTK